MFLIESVMFFLKVEFIIIVCIKCFYLFRCENIDVYNEEMCVVMVDSLDINIVYGELELVYFVGIFFFMYVYLYILLYDLYV